MIERIRLCSIDDHEIVHTGLRQMADDDPAFEFVGALDNPADAVDSVSSWQPDLVLLDLFMDEEQGWLTCAELVKAIPAIRVLMYSGYGNAQLVEKAFRLGASGYLLKSTKVRDLPGLLHQAHRTGECIDPALRLEWRRFVRNRVNAASVSDQELRIIRCIASGMDNYAIAEELVVSFHTVKFHIAKLLRRTGESNRAGLVRWAQEQFLLDP